MQVRRFTILALSWALLAACGSSRPRGNDAETLEERGDWEGAAGMYLSLLGTEKETPETRAQAAEAVSRALAARREAAEGFAAQSRWEAAITEYRKGDALLQRAQEAGVDALAPAGWGEGHAAAREGAVETQLQAADQLVQAQRWRDAAQAYRQVRGRQGITAAQTARTFAGESRALLDHARAEIAAGRFDAADALVSEALAIQGAPRDLQRNAQGVAGEVKAARQADLLEQARNLFLDGSIRKSLAVAQRAVAVYGEGDTASEEARALVARILQEGTRQVVVTPTGLIERLEGLAPDSLQARIDRALADAHWSSPPAFVAIEDPATVESTVVMLLFDDPILSTRRAGVLGRKLEADYVVVTWIDGFESVPDGQPTRRRTKHQDGHEVEYLLQPGLRMSIQGGWRLVATADENPQVLTEGTIAATQRRECKHVPITTVELDPVKLQLTDEEIPWFLPERKDAIEREMLEAAAQDLAGQIAKASFEQVTSRVP